MFDNYYYQKLESTDDTYASLLLRRRFCKRIFILLCVFVTSYCLAVYMFRDHKTARAVKFTKVNRCPACCGITACSSLYENFDHIIANPVPGTSPTVYHGYEGCTKVAWKHLAQDAVFKKFDKQICTAWGLKPNCKWKELFDRYDSNKTLEKIMKLVEFEDTPGKERKLLTFCPDVSRVLEFLQPGNSMDLDDDSQRLKNNLINLWTMLTINPEPAILQAMPISYEWPLPTFGGCCGRVAEISYEGAPLSSFFGVCWRRKLEIAANIIKAAADLTFQDRSYRFYLMDWSHDSILVNEMNEITFTNLKHAVIFDVNALTANLKRRFDKLREKNSYKNDKNFMKLNYLCSNEMSDHNIREACSLLVGGKSPFLLGSQSEVDPVTVKLLKECQKGIKGITVYKKASALVDHLKDMLKSVNVTVSRNVTYFKPRYLL